MTKLFLDIETVPEYKNSEGYKEIKGKVEKEEINSQKKKDEYWKFRKGSFNPHKGKIIVIIYSMDGGEKEVLKEWRSSEKKILSEFNNLIRDLKWPREIIGVNISGFDLPFLYERMKKLGINDSYWLYKNCFESLFPIDLLQTHLHLNGFDGEGVNHNNICSAYGHRLKSNDGSIIADLYYNKKYDRILEYIEEEFVYPDLFNSIMEEGVVSEEEFKKIIKEN